MDKDRKNLRIEFEQEQLRRMRKLNTPSWDSVEKMIEIRTQHKPRLQELTSRNIDELRIYYQDVYLATVNGIEPPTPDLMDGHNKVFALHTRIIRETVTGKIEKFSRGYKRHIRNEKAASKKGLAK